MKSMNVKKLAALGAAFAVAFAPVAHAAMHAENLPTDRNWYLNSTIVVGTGVDSPAKVEDVVAAAEISAAIAQLAYEKAEIKGEATEKKVKLETPGQIVIGGQGYHYDDAELNYAGAELASALELGKAKIPTLKENEDITVKYRASSSDSWEEDDATYTQKIAVDAGGIDIKSYVDNSKSALKMVVPDDKVHFKAEVKNLDIPVGSYSESGKTLDKFEIDILGQKYKITKLNVDANGDGTIEIATYSEEKVANVGDSVEVGEYTVKIAGVYGEDTPYAVLELYDSQGNLISKDKVGEDEDADFDEVNVRVEEVVPGENGWVKLSLKSDSTTISLDNGSGSKSDFPEDDWKLVVTVTGDDSWGSATKIESITFDVVYHDSEYDDAEHGIDVGGKLEFPGDAGYAIAFAGMTSETMHEFKLDSDKLEIIDKDGDPVTVKLEADKSLGKDINVSGDDSKILEFSEFINDKTLGVKIAHESGSYKVYVDYDYSGSEDEFSSDGSATFTDIGDYLEANVPVSVTDTDDIELTIRVTDSNSSTSGVQLRDTDVVYVLFKDNQSDLSSKDSPYKVFVDWWTSAGGGDDYNKFKIYVDTINGDSSHHEVAIPFRTEKDKWDFKEIKLGNDGDDVKVYLKTAATEKSLDADSDSDNVADTELLEDGTEVYVKSSDEVEVKVPEDVRKVDIFFGVPAKVEESAGVMELGEGDTIPGTNYKIKEIVAGEVKVEGDYYKQIASVDPTVIVRLDNEVGNTGNLIVVGGWYVNQIAKAIAEANPEIKEEVQKEGDYIVNKYDYNGQEAIVVFGWTAADTRKAAREFIKFLQENVQ